MAPVMVDDELFREFLVESYENLDVLDRELLALEADPGAHERIATIFRAIHTIKGGCGFLGFDKLGLLTHAGEDLLGLLRDGALDLTREISSALLALVDRVRSYLRAIESTGTDGDQQSDQLIMQLEAFGEHRRTPAGARGPVSFPPPLSEEQLFAPATPEELAAVPDFAPAPAPPAPPASEPPPPAPPTPAAAPTPPEETAASVSDSTVRVHVELLDKLMNLVGELVLARNQLVQLGARVEDPAFVGASQRLNQITSELQEGVMKTRMQPIGNLWTKLPRVVRDLATTCGKQVRVEMTGKDTELDRTVLEAIKDPLTHIVRNAVDHGIEPFEVRAARGKARTGTLRLRAFHESGQVNIEISDDGGGIDARAVRDKAVQRGLVSAERAARMSEHELHQLVFLPGFSTAKAITSVSGRGVGMDVVKTNIDKIGGTVELESREGQGTAIKIKIPLTLAIVPALVVGMHGHQFAIPQVSLLELVRVERRAGAAGSACGMEPIESIHGAPVYRLRGQLLPLVHLREVLGLSARPDEAEAPAVNIVVLQADDRSFGLIVDEVRDTEEIVVKPLGKELKHLSVFSGATIRGDGRVTLILDVLGLAHRAGAVSGARERAPAAVVERAGGPAAQTLLLFRAGGSAMAVPLSMVSRLEELPSHQVERSGGCAVVPCRGEILPLIEVPAALGAYSAGGERATLEVMVYSESGRSVGLVVDQVLAVVDHAGHLEVEAPRPGILGTTLVDGVVTHLLDVHGLIRDHHPGFHTGRFAS